MDGADDLQIARNLPHPLDMRRLSCYNSVEKLSRGGELPDTTDGRMTPGKGIFPRKDPWEEKTLWHRN